jgi:hypothetical protein
MEKLRNFNSEDFCIRLACAFVSLAIENILIMFKPLAKAISERLMYGRDTKSRRPGAVGFYRAPCPK